MNNGRTSNETNLPWDANLGNLILNAAGEGIFGLDTSGRTTFANPAACEMMGYEREEMLGVSSHDLIHHSHPDGRAYHSKDCPIYAAFSDGKVHSVSDEVFWRKDNKALQVEYTSTPLKRENELIGAVVVFRNLTPLRQSEESLREALNELQQLKDRIEAENSYLQEEIQIQNRFEEIVGTSSAMANVLTQVELVAPTPATVLISGETGTGKELIARAIHRLSPRTNGAFIKVNCAAIPEELFEAEFFGHSKGAFTGAMQARPGRFELANGGTLFLDEVGELPPSMQSKLLRVLQENEFERVGESRPRKVDIRMIAATNRDLKEEVNAGGFRSDLYYRLNVFPLEIAPLRERREDIPSLAQQFLQKAKTRFNRPLLRLSRSILKDLMQYQWPGNVRELQNVIERAAIVSNGKSLQVESLDTPLNFSHPKGNPSPVKTRILTNAETKALVRENVRLALLHCQGRIYGPEGAAALLEMKPTTLSSYIRKHNLASVQ